MGYLDYHPQVRSTGSATVASSTYVFHKIEPLSHLPKPETALERLTKLSNDPAIRHIMQKHKFSVGVLTELAPHEQPHLLGLNVNAGQSIKLRIRTDAYDGFRPYLEVRRVLCHELAHNVWSDHDNNASHLFCLRMVSGLLRKHDSSKNSTRSSTERFPSLKPRRNVERTTYRT